MRRPASGAASALTSLVVAALAPFAGSLGAQESERAVRLLEEAARRYEGVERLCADFRQEMSVPLLNEERVGFGRLCQERPDRFAMRFSDPNGDAVVVDGSWVWIYYPSLDPKQVLRLPVADVPGGFDLHREFLSDPATKYAARYEAGDEVEGRPTHRLRLVPRTPTTYQSAVVWIDRAAPILRRIRLEEENGSTRTITLSGVEFDGSVPEGWFAFTPPPGAQVISR